jgi:hypothetical protein
MNDRTTELHVVQAENTKLVAARVLTGFALALLGGAAAEVVLMFVSWVYSAMQADGSADFPGRYWFTVVPMLVGAAILQTRSRALKPR